MKMAQERRRGDRDGETLGEVIIRKPRLAIGISVGLFALTMIALKCEGDQRERECRPPSNCHRQLWEQTHPGEGYPWDRSVLPPGFSL